MMRIGLQEDMLPGATAAERFQFARDLGVDGIEVWGRALPERLEDLMRGCEASGLPVAAVNHGRFPSILDADPAVREQGLEALRGSIKCACDLGAAGVVFVPHFGPASLPDLTPWMSAPELEMELLNQHLRALEDFAEAFGVTLFVEPINRYETHFLNRLEQAAAVARKRKHARVKIVADVFHMALEETDLAAAIRDHADVIGHVHLADHNRRLPGQGWTPFAEVAAALNDIGFDGWAVYEPDSPGANARHAARYRAELPASLAALRAAGWR
jgi:sugar phosphate isomerase/epimerase